MEKYEFNITVTGEGSCPDTAFKDALKKLGGPDPGSHVTNEVVYTRLISKNLSYEA